MNGGVYARSARTKIKRLKRNTNSHIAICIYVRIRERKFVFCALSKIELRGRFVYFYLFRLLGRTYLEKKSDGGSRRSFWNYFSIRLTAKSNYLVGNGWCWQTIYIGAGEFDCIFIRFGREHCRKRDSKINRRIYADSDIKRSKNRLRSEVWEDKKNYSRWGIKERNKRRFLIRIYNETMLKDEIVVGFYKRTRLTWM